MDPGGCEGPQQGKLYLHMFIQEKIFSRTSRSISIKLGINHPWGKGILNCSNEGDCPSQRGDNYKRVKIH
jgi:hypothetical protein